MSILGPFDRPLALEVDAHRGLSPPRVRIAPPAPPPPVPDGSRRPAARPSLDRARFLALTLLGSAGSAASVVAELEQSVDERVVTWSPSMYTTSRAALVAEVLDRDDAVDEIEVEIADECLTATSAHVAWRFAGRFANVGFLNDDVLIEPSHRRIESAGVLVCTFAGPTVDRIECYYDCLGLLEQVLPVRSGLRPGG